MSLDEALRSKTGEELNATNKRLERAAALLDKAKDIDPTDPETLRQIAVFMEYCQQTEKAEEFYLQVRDYESCFSTMRVLCVYSHMFVCYTCVQTLEIDPNYLEALRGYAFFLDSINDVEAAEKFYTRIAASCPAHLM